MIKRRRKKKKRTGDYVLCDIRDADYARTSRKVVGHCTGKKILARMYDRSYPFHASFSNILNLRKVKYLTEMQVTGIGVTEIPTETRVHENQLNHSSNLLSASFISS